MKAHIYLIASFLALAFVGCAALDRLSPEFAAHPAVPAVEGSTTQPTTLPATPRNVPAQVADVAHEVVTNPVVVSAAGSFPYGTLVTGLIGIVTTGFLAYSRADHKSRADDAEQVIAAAAPEITAVIKSTTIPTGLQNGINDLLSHPAAVAAVASTVMSTAKKAA